MSLRDLSVRAARGEATQEEMVTLRKVVMPRMLANFNSQASELGLLEEMLSPTPDEFRLRAWIEASGTVVLQGTVLLAGSDPVDVGYLRIFPDGSTW